MKPPLDQNAIENLKAHARIEIVACKIRCRDNWDVSKWEAMHSIFGCWNFAHHCQNLRAAEERLRELERLEAAPPSLEGTP